MGKKDWIILGVAVLAGIVLVTVRVVEYRTMMSCSFLKFSAGCVR